MVLVKSVITGMMCIKPYKLGKRKMTAIKKAVATAVTKPLAKRAAKETKPKVVKATGNCEIECQLLKISRPLTVSDMAIGQVFAREGELCMRVLNVCNNNKKGQASPPHELWIISLSKHKVWMSSNVPIQLVDISIKVTAKAEESK
jgi:hypothetical protein